MSENLKIKNRITWQREKGRGAKTNWKNAMEDIHQIFTRFKAEFPEVYARHEALGKEVHKNAGPLGEKSRWLIKIAISAACKLCSHFRSQLLTFGLLNQKAL